MRYLMLALFGLLLAGGPAFAATRSDPAPPAPRQQASAAKAKPSAGQARASRPAPRARASARSGRTVRSASPHRATVRRAATVHSQLGTTHDDRAASASAACARIRGVTRCRPQSVMSWTQGLPPAAGVQANDCPAGTMATFARGHDDIVRCMPI